MASLLSDLLAVQEGLLSVLARKHALLAAGDVAGLSALAPEEDRLLGDLQQCVARRETLLAQAADEGLPASSIRALASALPEGERERLSEPLDRAASQAHLLRHQSLTQWVVVQRTLLHLSQILEIIATGGRRRPTYGREASSETGGALVDRAA